MALALAMAMALALAKFTGETPRRAGIIARHSKWKLSAMPIEPMPAITLWHISCARRLCRCDSKLL
jgi:hypothetical protein